MEDDTWSLNFSTSSRGYQSPLKSLSDLCIDFEEIEEEDDFTAEYPCPFCTEDFDLVDLCCHIDDEHHLEDDPGVCPVCGALVDLNMVGHITTQHGTIFKSLQKLKLTKDESLSSFSFLKKELEDGYLPSLLAGSSAVFSSKMESDPLLSFLYNVRPSEKPESVQSGYSSEATLEEKSLDDKLLESNVRIPPLSDEEQMEKAKRSDFVQGLLSSTIFDDDGL